MPKNKIEKVTKTTYSKKDLLSWVNKTPCTTRLAISLISKPEQVLFRYTFYIDSQVFEILYTISLFSLQESNVGWRSNIAACLSLILKRRNVVREVHTKAPTIENYESGGVIPNAKA